VEKKGESFEGPHLKSPVVSGISEFWAEEISLERRFLISSFMRAGDPKCNTVPCLATPATWLAY